MTTETERMADTAADAARDLFRAMLRANPAALSSGPLTVSVRADDGPWHIARVSTTPVEQLNALREALASLRAQAEPRTDYSTYVCSVGDTDEYSTIAMGPAHMLGRGARRHEFAVDISGPRSEMAA